MIVKFDTIIMSENAPTYVNGVITTDKTNVDIHVRVYENGSIKTFISPEISAKLNPSIAYAIAVFAMGVMSTNNRNYSSLDATMKIQSSSPHPGSYRLFPITTL